METNYQHYKHKINKYKSDIDNKFFLDTYDGTINFCDGERCKDCMFRQLNRNSYGYSCRYVQMIDEWNELEFQPIISIDYKKHHFNYNPATWHGKDDTGRIYCYSKAETAVAAFKERIDKFFKNITNYEYSSKEINKITRLGISFGVTEDEQILPCPICSKCIFNQATCNSDKLKWADELREE